MSKITTVKCLQEMMPKSWAQDFLAAHVNYVRKVRKGEIPAETFQLDYGLEGSNPDGVGASSLAREARQWWYGRKKYEHNEGPNEYRFTAEQGRMIEIPVRKALEEMGVKFQSQAAVKTKNYGGLVDGIGDYNGTIVLFESKHIGASRFLDAWYRPLWECSPDYFWQAQAYLEGSDTPYSLFVVTAQDSSSVKKMLTDDKRFNSKKGFYYNHDNEPNPKVFAFKMYRANLHKVMDKRAVALLTALKGDKPPMRELDPSKDWQCRSDFCGYRDRCLQDGKDGEAIFTLPEVDTKLVYL